MQWSYTYMEHHLATAVCSLVFPGLTKTQIWGGGHWEVILSPRRKFRFQCRTSRIRKTVQALFIFKEQKAKLLLWPVGFPCVQLLMILRMRMTYPVMTSQSPAVSLNSLNCLQHVILREIALQLFPHRKNQSFVSKKRAFKSESVLFRSPQSEPESYDGWIVSWWIFERYLAKDVFDGDPVGVAKWLTRRTKWTKFKSS